MERRFVVFVLASAAFMTLLLFLDCDGIAQQLAFGTATAGFLWLFAWNDVWGLLWWLAALALIRQSRNQLLLATCFCYTIVLEWVGTAIGNWHWNAVVPGLGLHSANPPAGVGILYILLDLVTVAI